MQLRSHVLGDKMSEEERPPMSRVIDLNLARRQDEDPSPPARLSFGQVVEGFRDAIAAAGLGRPEIVADGSRRVHRFDLPDEKPGKRGGWYVFYPDNNPCPAGAFGAWKHEFSESWSSKANWELSSQERDQLTEHLRQARLVRDEERRREADEAASKATALLSASPDASDEHPYLQRKRIHALGLKLGERNQLLVPMFDMAGQVRGLQRITENGDKLFLKGVDPKGVFGWIEGDKSTIYLTEGYATGASVHMATGQAVALAFNAGNLEPAATAVKEVFPRARIIVAADNDRWTTKQDGTPWNVGIEKAHRAAEAVGATIMVPEFRDLSTRPTDFNDLHVLEGLDSVRTQVKGYSTRIREYDLAQLNGRQVPQREWLVEDVIPMNGAFILAAPGGTGKGLLTLDLAIKVCLGPGKGIDLNASAGALGHKVLQHGPVIIFSAEDDIDEIHRRAAGLCGEFPRGLYVLCLPDMDGLKAIATETRGGCEPTAWWLEMVEQIIQIKPKLIIIDPLACFVWADLNDRKVGASVMGMLTHLAKQAQSAVVVIHHLNKLPDGIKDLDAAKAKISGSAGFVDHVRGAYVLWPEEESRAKKLCKDLKVDYKRGNVVCGGLAKCNYPGDQELKTFLRDERGLLVVSTDRVKQMEAVTISKALKLLVRAIEHAAAQGHPFQHSGRYGLYERREMLPESLRAFGKDKLLWLGRVLLDENKIAKYRAAGSKAEVWLDIPTGPFAQGIGTLEHGDYEGLNNIEGEIDNG
ncbi:hypothetical protein JCM15519_07230 [Fundidesulfovibrio butyratiphilus]